MKIIEKIEASDIVVADAQDLSKVYTPFGPQPTVLKHQWEAHDMALINVEDFQRSCFISCRTIILKFIMIWLST